MSEQSSVENDKLKEERNEAIEILDEMENDEGVPILVTLSKIRDKHSENYYGRFKNDIIEPLKDEGRIIEVPHTGKGRLFQTPDNVNEAVIRLKLEN